MAENAEGKIDRPVPVQLNGRFGVPWCPWRTPPLYSVAKWMLTSKNNTNLPSKKELEEQLPLIKPDFNHTINEDDVRVTWLGHATVLIQMENITLLTDPIFSDRASPVQAVGSKRFRGPPCTIEDLPKIDLVLISHNHYDHLDSNSVRKLNSRFGNEIVWFVPLGLKKWMNDTGCERVHELNWWDKHQLTTNVEIIATPAQHWSKRTINDDNKSLWSSWCVVGSRTRFFFAGDTGYPKERAIFKFIGDEYGPFDLAAIPIGAYEPRWFMQDQHVNPTEAVQIHQDVRARFSVGVHWGTFALANEHYLAPRNDLSSALKEQNIDPSLFFTLNHGESRIISKKD